VTRLHQRFYNRDATTLAQALLGQVLVRVLADGLRLSGIIVETEAYLGIEDRAAHTCGGRRTARNASMWGSAGHAYVYFTYGMHHCVNVVAEAPGQPSAVLLRALEPLEGIERMRAHRAVKMAASRVREVDLCSGPAKLAQALAIDRALDGADLVAGQALFIEHGHPLPADRIAAGPRIGVDYAGEWAQKPLRFCVVGNPNLSRAL
jgi:DNA-3-methyladenine glycosylase